MKIKQLIDEQMKKFDEKFCYPKGHILDELLKSGLSAQDLKSFITTHTRKLIEAVGEELLPELTDNGHDEKNAYTAGWKDERKDMRYKLKEIVKSLK